MEGSQRSVTNQQRGERDPRNCHLNTLRQFLRGVGPPWTEVDGVGRACPRRNFSKASLKPHETSPNRRQIVYNRTVKTERQIYRQTLSPNVSSNPIVKTYCQILSSIQFIVKSYRQIYRKNLSSNLSSNLIFKCIVRSDHRAYRQIGSSNFPSNLTVKACR